MSTTSPATNLNKTSPSKSNSKPKTTYFGSYRFRVEDYNWFPIAKYNGAYTYESSLLRVGVTRSTPTDDLTLELMQPTLIDLPHTANAPSPIGNLGQGGSYYNANHNQSASVFIKQAFVRFKQLGGEPADTLQVGRFSFSDGGETVPDDPSLAYIKSQRLVQHLISTSNFTNGGRAFDGVHFSNDTRLLNLTVFAASPTRGVYDLDGWDTLDQVKIAYFGSTFLQPGVRASGESRLFAVYYSDERTEVAKIDNRPSSARAKDKAAIRLGTFGAHYLGHWNLGAGRMDGLLWGAGQVGDWGTLRQAAEAYDAELGYELPRVAWKPWVRVGYAFNSGDGNPKDNVHGTFIPLLTNSHEFARFPFFTQVNLKDAFAQVILRPNSKLTIRSDAHSLKLADPNDFWYTGSGAYENLNFGYSARNSGGHTNLGLLFDISADYQLRKNTLLTLYLAYARGGDVELATFKGREADFAYFELTQRF
jgi:hypothetical protein